MTATPRVNLTQRKLMGLIDLKTRFLDFLEWEEVRGRKMICSGPTVGTNRGGFFTGAGAVDGAGLHDLTFTQLRGTNGAGELIDLSAGAVYTTNVPFEDAPAVTYYLACRIGEIPTGVVLSPLDGDPEYDAYSKELAYRDEPTAVVDNGDGTITFTLGNHALPADDFTGRIAKVWIYNTPMATDTATAIESCIVNGRTITTVGSLGQTSISITPGYYRVAVLGPDITRSSAVATATGVAYIGTVIGGGAPRVFSTSGQIQTPPLSELAQRGQILRKGWLVKPIVYIGVGTIQVDSSGIVYVGEGVIQTTGTIFTPLPLTAERFIAWDNSLSQYVMYTTFDAANSAYRVPAHWIKTDGAGLITGSQSLSRNIYEHNEAHVVTLATDPALRADFTSFQDALAWCYAVQSSSHPRECTIELIGDVDHYWMTNQTLIGGVTRLTVRGRGTSLVESANTPVRNARWPRFLLQLNAGAMMPFMSLSGATVCDQWSFEDITFSPPNVNPAGWAQGSAFFIDNTAKLKNCSFNRCRAEQSSGSATRFTSFIGANSTTPQEGLSLEDCEFHVRDRVIYNAQAAGGFSYTAFGGYGWGLRVKNCTWVGLLETPLFLSTQGFIWDEGTGRNWRITDNYVLTNGRCVSAAALSKAWIHDNFFENRDNNFIIRLGTGTSYSVAEVWIYNNHIRNDIAGSLVYGTQHLISIQSGSYNLGVFIHDNFIDGDADDLTAGGAGIYFDGSGSGLGGSLIAHHNILSGCRDGIQLVQRGYGSVISGNVIMDNYSTGIWLSDLVNNSIVSDNVVRVYTPDAILVTGDRNVVSGNVATAQDASANGAISLLDPGDYSVASGNVGWLSAANVTGRAIRNTQDYGIIVGNSAQEGQYPLLLGRAGGTPGVCVGNQAYGGVLNDLRLDAGSHYIAIGNNIPLGLNNGSASSTVAPNEP